MKKEIPSSKRGRAGKPAKKVKSSGPAASGIEATLKRMLEIRNQLAALKAEFEGLKARI